MSFYDENIWKLTGKRRGERVLWLPDLFLQESYLKSKMQAINWIFH